MVSLDIINIWLYIEIVASVIIILSYVLWNIPAAIRDLRRIYRGYVEEYQKERMKGGGG